VQNSRERFQPATASVATPLVALVCFFMVVAVMAALSQAQAGPGPPIRLPAGPTYATLAGDSVFMLEHEFYDSAGKWHMCVPLRPCNSKNFDWGADSLTYDLYLRWQAAKDPSVLRLLRKLARTAKRWTPGAFGSSDNMMWDAVASVREYQATGSSLALADAEADLATLNNGQAGDGFAAGACPAIYYQWRYGSRDGAMKTLETDSNYVKAALLLYQVTRDRAYLTDAELRYAAIRRYYLSAGVPLYADFMIDNGTTCRPVSRFFLGSANGNMIWNGATLATDTGRTGYLRQAIATARAVAAHLRDGAGVYNGLFTDIDIGEPLVEAMYVLATTWHEGFARRWLIASAAAASADMNSRHEFGRFYDGPPPGGQVTSWEVNGGVALMIAAAGLDAGGRPADPWFWQGARWVPDDARLRGPSLKIRVTGRAIAIVGTIGDVCCRAGHAWVAVDGVPTFSRVGIWQNRSSPARRQTGQVLFAWRWHTAGRYTVTILPPAWNVLQGGTYFHMIGYLVVR
jgi:hypothetical protein